MTKKEMYAKMLTIEAVANDVEMVSFINHEIELLEKKSTTAKKPTKTQIENDALKSEIVNYLIDCTDGKCIKEIQRSIDSLAELTNQRITHLLTDLVKAGTLNKNYVKKVPFYSIAS